jgi:hypothetical protein
MNHPSRSLSVALIILAAPVVATACSSDDDASLTTEVVVAGAPLSISGPVLVADGQTDVVTGTIRNVTDRTIEITSASSPSGAVEFRSADGSLLSSLKVEPNSELELVVGGVRLVFVDAMTDESVEVVLGLDIEDDFSFSADRLAGE